MNVILNNVCISSLVTWLPPQKLSMRTLSSQYGEEVVTNVIKGTGIEEVRVATPSTTSSDMCLQAAEVLIKNYGINKKDIDGIVFVSQTCDYLIPSTSIILQDRLGLSTDTVCIDIHYACSGYIYGLYQAALWISSGSCNNVLVLAGDTTTRMVNPNDYILRMEFGDCGSATLVSRGEGTIGFVIKSDGSGYEKIIVRAGGFRIPVSEETSRLVYDSNNCGRTQNDLFMDGLGIFSFVSSKVPKLLNEHLDFVKWDKNDVGLWALHQSNSLLLKLLAQKLKVDANKVPCNTKYFGNTGPATIPLLLTDLCSESHNYDLSKVLMSGFGVGLSWGSVSANMSKTKFYNPVNI